MPTKYSIASLLKVLSVYNGLPNLTFLCAELYCFIILFDLHRQTNEGARANSLSNTLLREVLF